MFSKESIERYFIAEKQESLLFMLLGIAALIFAGVCWFYFKTSFYKGMILPLLVVGALMLVVGFTVYKRSDSDRIRNVYALDMNPGELKEKEIPRMEIVMKNFVIYRYTEIVLFLLGIGSFFYFRSNADKAFWSGLGLGLFIMAFVALIADGFAERRGAIYLEGLKSFVNK